MVNPMNPIMKKPTATACETLINSTPVIHAMFAFHQEQSETERDRRDTSAIRLCAPVDQVNGFLDKFLGSL
jgi:hypothetical protein